MNESRKRGFFVRYAKLGKWDLSLYPQCDTYATDDSAQDPMGLIANAIGYGRLIEGHGERIYCDGYFR